MIYFWADQRGEVSIYIYIATRNVTSTRHLLSNDKLLKPKLKPLNSGMWIYSIFSGSSEIIAIENNDTGNRNRNDGEKGLVMLPGMGSEL